MGARDKTDPEVADLRVDLDIANKRIEILEAKVRDLNQQIRDIDEHDRSVNNHVWHTVAKQRAKIREVQERLDALEFRGEGGSGG